MRRKTGTLVDPQTGELTTKYMGFNTRNKMWNKMEVWAYEWILNEAIRCKKETAS